MAEMLLNCPFCGGEAKFEIYGGACSIVCQTCQCGTPVVRFGDGMSIIERWNLRAERIATIEVSHGAHGPDPRFVGDVWTMHHACSACGGAVDGGDRYCKHCGARLERRVDS